MHIMMLIDQNLIYDSGRHLLMMRKWKIKEIQVGL
jgi:hypothetical protein